jgi:hypothetical protein
MKKSDTVCVVPLVEIVPDDCNANKGTQRGYGALEESIRQHGFLEAGVLDANNRIVGGNKRTEIGAQVLMAENALVIDIDGTRPVFVRRKDLDLDTAQGRMAALRLNRVAQLDIDWEPAVLQGLISEHALDVSRLWNENEFNLLMASLEATPVEVEPAAAVATEEESAESGNAPPISVTPEQRAMIERGIAQIRADHGHDVTEGKAVAMIVEEWFVLRANGLSERY